MTTADGTMEGFTPGIAQFDETSPSEGIPKIRGLLMQRELQYGPYGDYMIVNTDWGDYACKQGLILMFQQRNVFNKKELRWEVQAFPIYFVPVLDDAGAVIRRDDGFLELDRQIMGSGVEFEDYRRPKPRTTAGL